MDTASASALRLPWARALRVRHWFHFLVLPLAGYDPAFSSTANALGFARGVGIAFAVLAFGYLLNQVSDRHMDASVHKNPLAQGGASSNYGAALVALGLTALALSLAGPRLVTIATLAALASGLLYSVGPRIKSLPWVGTLANATNFAPLLWVGLPGDSVPPGLVALTLCFALLLLQNQLVHEAADREDDERGGVRTTVRVIGVGPSAAAAAGLGLALIAVVVQTASAPRLAAGLAVVFALAFPLAILRRGMDVRFMANARLAHRVASAFAGAAIFAATRLA